MDKTTKAHQLSKRALGDPPPRLYLKAVLTLHTADHIDDEVEIDSFVEQYAAVVGGVAEHSPMARA